MLRLFILFALLAAGAPARANDSTAELGAGGILLTRSGDISLESEDLFISMDEVRVDYVFRNATDSDLETIVAFPMPELPGGIDNAVSVPSDGGDNFLDFSVVVEGKAITPQLDQRAVAAGIDVTEALREWGVPLVPAGAATHAALEELPEDVADDWVTRGMIALDSFDDGSGWKTERVANWTLRSAYWWRAVFPAGQPVQVSHRYRPSVGQTAGLTFMHDDGPGEYFDEYRNRYCMDDAFLRAVKRARRPGGYLSESRISYVLSSGGNWRSGTIERFRLTVDKGSTANLVSFCGSGVRKVAPTRFEMTAQDFYPDKDIEILIVMPLAN